MYDQAPPTLVQLAARSLLRNQALAISALEDLPLELFPPLFREAFAKRCTEALKALVQAWPFPCLPLGALLRRADLEYLQICLEGLQMLLAPKVRSRRWKLQVLDLRNLHHNFWKVWAGNELYVYPEQAQTKWQKRSAQENEAGVEAEPEPPLKVLVDLSLREETLDPFFACLLLWVEQRKTSVQLSCKKLKIITPHIHSIKKILEQLQLGCVEEVEVNCNWTLPSLVTFATYLGRMGNLRSLLLSHVHQASSIAPEEQEQLVLRFTSQFAQLACLQELSIDSVCFLEGRLHQVLGCLRTPLESLSITDSRLSESDLTCLSQSPSVRQLSGLNLSGVRMTGFSPEPLRVLLESVAATVKTLDLEDCGIHDAQLTAILPALSRCSSLTTFNYLRNPVSMAALESLLVHTVRLSHLSLEMYSTPLEAYGPQGSLHQWRLNQLRDELMTTAEPLRHSRTVWFSTIPCPLPGNQVLIDEGAHLCPGCYFL
ncbi:PRAME family member 12-like [Perognathus longimembris pacificus]|uniref:PRAME family member 12-like n=1 Tax=Perognathus longimembris pacificus TaxID=214514 RepID=UPI00201939B1|nr:PRAME family member 12-like [Perognathus longimembris pacificus]